ncbi:hypothetical protein ASE60_23230 [Ensifer sp. Root278]|nr:hypothetical protein ASE60_23230 [Ensifer sp. Root278]
MRQTGVPPKPHKEDLEGDRTGAEMPLFASLVLLDSPEGREMLRRYAVSYFDLAQVASRGFVTRRPGRQWRLGAESSGATTLGSGTSTGAPSPSPAICVAPIVIRFANF